MSLEKIDINEVLELNIDYDLDASYLYDDLWENSEVSFISNHRDYKSEGELKNLDIGEFSLPDGYDFMPVNAHIHSGIALSLTSFNDRWDSGIFGYIVFKKGEFGDNNEGLKNFVAHWSQVLNGEVYYVSLLKKEKCNLGHIHSEVIESLGGLTGNSYFDIIKDFMENFDLDKTTIELIKEKASKL